MPTIKTIIHAAPLQGFTDYHFRRAYHRHFGGVDLFYAPFIRLEKGKIKAKNLRDILPENNSGFRLIPQVLARDPSDFLYVVDALSKFGYEEVNWNLGCPYPMVAKRGLGSGLLNEPDQIAKVLELVTRQSNIKISVKMRLGYNNPDEIFRVIPVLNNFPVQNVAIHPRIGKQLYKGTIDLERFKKSAKLLEHTVIYNGDIRTFEDFKGLSNKFPVISNWMLGRGMMHNPALPRHIKNRLKEKGQDGHSCFFEFHQELLESNQALLSGDHQVLQKMKPYWHYFSDLFSQEKKALKKIKKAQKLEIYQDAVNSLRR